VASAPTASGGKKKNKKNKGKGAGKDFQSTADSATIPTPTANNPTSQKEQQQRKPLLGQKTQDDMVKQAFAGPDLEAEFHDLKDKAIDEEMDMTAKKRKIMTEGDKQLWVSCLCIIVKVMFLVLCR
jgi:U3 small nucleolar RNA-associated protein 14